MKTLMTVLALTLTLTSCGRKDDDTLNPVVIQQNVPDSSVQQIVDELNATRQTEGQEPLTQGMSCNLYTVPTSTTQIVGATLTSVTSFLYQGQFNQPNASVTAGFNVLPTALQTFYQTWFVLKCTGTLIVTDTNWHEFDLTSDDGSNLYIDGLLINNDGLHSIKTVSAIKLLTYGSHSFELDFLQGGGMQALILNKDGALMDTSTIYH